MILHRAVELRRSGTFILISNFFPDRFGFAPTELAFVMLFFFFYKDIVPKGLVLCQLKRERPIEAGL